MSIEDTYKFTTAEESVTSKDWACGSREQMSMSEFVIDRVGKTYVGKYATVKYAPAWWKIIDECIVNALDQAIRTNKVTMIKIGFDKTGRVRVYNDGPGVEVVIHKIATEKLGKPIWLPSLIFGMLFQGSNRTRAPDCIIGGTNGLGAKLANCFSTDFTEETSDHLNMKYFRQDWHNHMSIADPPTVIDLTQPHKLNNQHTHSHNTVVFNPDYIGLFGYKQFGETEWIDLVPVVRARAAYASAYIGFACKGVSVWFNDELLPFKSMSDIASVLFPGASMVKTVISPVIDPKKKSRIHYKFPWEITAIVAPNTHGVNLSNINGVVVRDGNHIKYARGLITKAVQEKILKMFNEKEAKLSGSYAGDNLFIMLNTQIPNPGWEGQRKDVLVAKIDRFAGYSLDTKFASKIIELMQASVTKNILSNIPTATGKKTTTVTYEKYTPAMKCNTKQALKCTLIASEGDSASTQVCTGIANNMGFEFYGVISLGGVIMNARKQCTVTETANGKYVKSSTKFDKNILVNALCEVTGLNPSYEYMIGSATYKKEMSELRYGHFCAYVDQDTDGKGNILGLILNIFDLFWPNLLDAGYVQWAPTAIARSFPKRGGKVIEFYSMPAYNKWTQTANLSAWTIKYYKGIGTHSRDEIISMFARFADNLQTFYRDSRSRELFEIYYGDDPNLRKIELASPTRTLDAETIETSERTKLISCYDHLSIETNLYQKDNLERKLDHVIDGQNQAGRMILDALLKAFKVNDPIKVASLAGYVSQHENYLHGEASLADSITGKGLVTPGGKQLPIIVPLSNFGSRKGGGSDASPPRYIYTKLNNRLTSLLFPNVDYDILPFKDDVDSCEPKYFVPIIPMAVIESTMLPAHGWQLKTWGRDVFKLIANVKRLIRLGDDAEMLAMPPCTYKGAPYEWHGEIKTIRGEPYSFGKYTIEGRLLVIVELPLRVWTTTYVLMLKKWLTTEGSLLESVDDFSDDRRVCINVMLKQGALEIITLRADSYFADGIEEYFQLRDHMNSQLNMMNMDGGVSEFKTYDEIVRVWFPIRREYYRKRVERSLIMLRLRVRFWQNIIRYTREAKMVGLKKIVMIERASAEGYDKFYNARLTNPGFTPTDELESVILGPDADYGYLFSLSDDSKSDEEIIKNETRLANLTIELNALSVRSVEGRFTGAAIWDSELTELEDVIRDGFRTSWLFEDFGKFQY